MISSTTLIAAASAMLAVLLAGSHVVSTLRRARTPAATLSPPRRWRRPTTRRRAPLGELAVAAWCEDVARALRAGAAMSTAIDEATSGHPAMRQTIGPVLAAVGRGRSLGVALEELPADPATAVGLAVSVLRMCAELGGPAAASLERVGATLRTRAAIREEQHAHSAQARLSARVLTLVPVALLGLLALTEPNVRAALGTSAGGGVVVAGGVLNVAGWRWMQHIIGRRA